MTIMTDDARTAEAVTEWAAAYAARRRELAVQLLEDEAFRKWADRARAQNWSLQFCVGEWLDQNLACRVSPFPLLDVVPWAVESNAGWGLMGGEVNVVLLGPLHSFGEAWARRRWGVSVVVDEIVTGEPVGTFRLFSDAPIVDCNIDDLADHAPSAREVADMARVFSALADEMQCASTSI